MCTHTNLPAPPERPSPPSSLADPPRKSPRLFTTFLILSVVTLGVLSFLLARNNRQLKLQITAAQQALTREQTKDSLAVGESVGPLTLVDTTGTERVATLSGERSTLLFMVSGHCPYCDETLPVWDRLLRRTDARTNTALSILCIQIDARAPEELKQLPDTLSPTFAKNEGATWLHRIPISPGAVLIDRAGIVRKTWFGVPSQRDEREIETALLGG